MEIPSFYPPTRYGCPSCDQLLPNSDHEYVIGYSYTYRMARFALEVIRPTTLAVDTDRIDTFRPDPRIPNRFSAELTDYAGSGYDRGHLVCSANRLENRLENCETFLLSNIAPQAPALNRGLWKQLEAVIRSRVNASNVLEVYVASGPAWVPGQILCVIGGVPVPTHYWKSMLEIDDRGSIVIHSWLFPNSEELLAGHKLADFRVTCRTVEKVAGLPLWDRIQHHGTENLFERL